MLRAKSSFIVESNFYPRRATPVFQALRATYPFQPVQIACVAPIDLRMQRMMRRTHIGERHPGHADFGVWASRHLLRLLFYTWFKLRLLSTYPNDEPQVLDLDAQTVVIDTSEPRTIPYAVLLQRIVEARCEF